jgi:predicted ArsR family transcriptional regulator
VKYVAGFDDGLVTVVKGGRGRPERLYRTAKVQNTAKQTGFGGDLAVPLAGSEDQVQTAKPPIYE